MLSIAEYKYNQNDFFQERTSSSFKKNRGQCHFHLSGKMGKDRTKKIQILINEFLRDDQVFQLEFDFLFEITN